MELVLDIAIILFCFTIFAVSHSLLALNSTKNYIAIKYPEYLPFYRIGFVALAIILFFLYFIVTPKPDIIIYDLLPPFDLLTLIPQLIAIIGLLYTLRQFDLKEFMGYEQIKRWKNHSYNKQELDEHKTLHIKGPYRICRHPLYLFTIMLLGFRPYMTLFYFLTFLATTLYFYIGSFYEERKLIEVFGSQYIEYQKKTGRILPFKLSNLRIL
ncbi:MAG: isoprenylcysteine carboxylmethyltransferase family protein [Ignavibacteriales bacterium]|nr:methyltransferase [Ignavibacteriaceae bacterium]NLH61624.1 isoprenylcysteine carboxylmethyltransferase family protein [Ignavibacteriales bacterium]HPO56300.1 methyltransferase [Ignavibacteriaceae bacterium]